MGNFAENLNLGNRVRPPLSAHFTEQTPSAVIARCGVLAVRTVFLLPMRTKRRFKNSMPRLKVLCGVRIVLTFSFYHI